MPEHARPTEPPPSRFSSDGPGMRAGEMRSRRKPPQQRFKALVPWLIGLVALTGVGLTLATRMIAPSSPTMTLDTRGRVAVLPLRNDGPRSDDWTAWGLAAVISEGLVATDGVQVLDPAQFFRVLVERDIDASIVADRERAHTLAGALGADLVVDVALRRDQDRAALLTVSVTDRERRPLAELEITDQDPMAAASDLVVALAEALGGGRAPVPLDQALSADPFVDRLYAEGLDKLLRRGAADASPYFEIALRNRPDFVHAKLRFIECLRRAGKTVEAVPVAEELLGQAQSRGNRALQADAFRALGLLEAMDGDPVAAAEQYKQAARLDGRRGDQRGEAASLYEQARLALAGGRGDEAEALFIQALEKRRAAGDRLGEIDLLVRLGSLFLTDGRYDEAGRLLDQGLSAANELRDVWNEFRIVASLGEVAWRQGRLGDAVDLWDRALTFYRRQEDSQRVLLLSRNLGRVLIEKGDYAAAEQRYRDQLDLSQELDNPRLEAEATVQLAWLQLRQGYPFQARPLVSKAVELDRHLTDRTDLQRVIAWLAYEEENYTLALTTLGDLRRQAPEQWTELDEAFLAVYGQARVQRRRLPLPGERQAAG